MRQRKRGREGGRERREEKERRERKGFLLMTKVNIII